jgi:hypothetical protein
LGGGGLNFNPKTRLSGKKAQNWRFGVWGLGRNREKGFSELKFRTFVRRWLKKEGLYQQTSRRLFLNQRYPIVSPLTDQQIKTLLAEWKMCSPRSSTTLTSLKRELKGYYYKLEMA